MRLSKFTDYSLRVLIYINLDNDQRATTQEISGNFEISNNHLIKVIHNLSKLKLIESFKGKNGGIALAKKAEDINIGKLIRKLENDSPLLECFSENNTCKINKMCRLKSALKKAQSEFYAVLESYSLEDISQNQSDLRGILKL